jgi:ribosomal protein L40E
MSEQQIRCYNCGALNPPTADWCNQCLSRFSAPSPPPPPPPPPSAQEETTVADVQPAPSAPAARPLKEGRGGPVKVTEAGITWECAICGGENLIDATVCTVCGASFAQTVRPDAERPQRDPGTAALVSLFFPGAGHAYLDMWGQAVARGVTTLWVIVVIIVGALEGPMVIPILFGLIAFGLWVVAAHDAYREASGDPNAVILKPRYFLYLVLGLLLLLFLFVVVAGLQAR